MTYNFSEIEGDFAILANKGVYTQTTLHMFENYLFAKCGNGYIRLYTNGSTSKDKVRVVFIDTTMPLYCDRLGRLLAIKKCSKNCFEAKRFTCL